MRLGIVRVSYQMLEQALHLPDGMTIRRVFDDSEAYDRIILHVTGDRCPEVPEGEAIPWIDWKWTRHERE
jgi:hypothetical protein